MTTVCSRQDDAQLTFWKLGKQQVTVDFNGGRIVSDAGLLAIREFEQKLGIIKGLTERLPDPRNPLFVVHTAENILTQNVYQFLAGYFDSNDAQVLRDDPLFQTLVGTSPDQEDGELASGSTLSRFQYSYTRRQLRRPPEERPAFFEQRQSQLDRVHVLNDYFVDLFISTRRQRPAHVIIDLDATDDPTHGQQVLSFYHGYYRQKQYFPCSSSMVKRAFPWPLGCGQARCTPRAALSTPSARSSSSYVRRGRTWRFSSVETLASACRKCAIFAKTKVCFTHSATRPMPR